MRGTDFAEALPTSRRGGRRRGRVLRRLHGGLIAGHTDATACSSPHDGVFDLRSMYGATEELWFPEWEFQGPY